MPPLNYDTIEPNLAEVDVAGAVVRVKWKCPLSGKIVASSEGKMVPLADPSKMVQNAARRSVIRELFSFISFNLSHLIPGAAGRVVRRIARRAGITKRVGPHTLRHAFITAALDAGVPLRDVQEAASHADPRTTMRYDRARKNLDRHPNYILAAYMASGT